MKYGKNEKQKEHSIYLSDTYNPIENKNQVKDLGVTLNDDISHDKHIENQIDKVKRINAWVYRTFKIRDTCVVLRIVCTPLRQFFVKKFFLFNYK